jgi:myo-inositol-1(or 4)-monophosphatase
MSNALLKVAKILRRDFNELEKIQNSKNNIDRFVLKSIENSKEILNFDLQKARPEAEVCFVDEEDLVLKDKDYVFLAEPVSGIKNYAHGISYFSSSVALCIKGDIVASIIYDPIRDEMFFAEKGKGAYLNNSRIRVSLNKEINKGIFVLEDIDLLNLVNEKSNNIFKSENFRILGSSSLDLANTANGKIDCYFTKKIKDQQSLAGFFLVKEAGGVLHEVSEFKYNIVTSNNMITNF